MNEYEGDFIFPSYWADYLAKVAEITLLPVTYVWHNLSLAQGRQYVMVWYYRQGFRCRHPSQSLPVTRMDEPL